ncbi:uncharacterized protein K489DRAFT_376394 [Dissoconium aciculare CBS 342.82]|uniref:Uncharacterized protein n=1 Tax=Dissoconium aciculare CBS 342.82 TaxID=1314786 RepID=A0A6J3MDA2_9PEZI|nr:uncharacterized protein K489DRAFT_376394 [Dissoconium aciculare CBS 342.82]KAF1825996.1 hypothetical protein K489DRAFT_376394 [Dissoconium aciculare CBS 342.82]
MDVETAASGSTLGFSDLSAMENETDDLGRRILQHQRYSTGQQFENHVQPFSRARPRKTEPLKIETIVQTVKDEHRHRRTASDGSAAANLSLNVPKEWGRRARRRPDWLRSYESDDTPTSIAKLDDDAILPRRTAFTGDESPILQRSATRERIVQSVEQQSPSFQRVRGSTSPWSLKHMNTTLRSGLDMDEEELGFADNSILTSTPAGNLRDYKQNALTRHEIMVLEQRGVTRKTLDQISERSHDLGGSRFPTSTGDQIAKPTRRRRSGASNKENEDFGHGEDTDSKSQRSSGSSAHAPEPQNTRSYSHARQDSIALLRKLARVTSLSPSPAKPMPANDTEDVALTRDSTGDTAHVSAQRLRGTRVLSIKSEPESMNANSDTSTAGPTGSGGDLLETGEPAVTSSKSNRSQAKSALEDVLREAQEQKNIHLGESTIASLEDIVHPNEDPSDLKTSPNDFDGVHPTVDRLKNVASAKNVRLEEDLALQKLNQSLRTTRTNIKDASKGLRRIENKIEAAQWEPPIVLSTATKPLRHQLGDATCQHCGGRQNSAWHTLWNEFRSNFYTWDSKRQSPLRLTWLGLACLLWTIWYLTETTLCAYYCHQAYAVEMVGYGVDPDAPDYPFVIPTLLFRPFKPIWHPVLQYLAWSFGVLLNLLFGDGFSVGVVPNVPRREPKRRFGQRAMSTGASFPVFAKAVDGNAGWLSAAATATSSAVRHVAESTFRAASDAGSMWEDAFHSTP